MINEGMDRVNLRHAKSKISVDVPVFIGLNYCNCTQTQNFKISFILSTIDDELWYSKNDNIIMTTRTKIIYRSGRKKCYSCFFKEWVLQRGKGYK